MSKPIVYLLYGNISSGKSTLTRKLVHTLPGTVALNDDAVSFMLGAGDYKHGFSSVPLPDVHNTLRYFATILLGRGKNVVIDVPSLTEAQRAKFWFGSGVSDHVIVRMPWYNPEVHAQRRFANEPRGYTLQQWREVAYDNEHRKEEPTVKEFPWIITESSSFSPPLTPSGGGLSLAEVAISLRTSSPLRQWQDKIRAEANDECPDCFGGEDFGIDYNPPPLTPADHEALRDYVDPAPDQSL